MIYLNDEAILYAISMCRRRRGYIVGIALSSMRQLNSISHMIMSCMREYRVKRECYFIASDIDIRFDNGSRIYLLPVFGHARGNRVHLLIVDENIDYGKCQEIYRPIECLEDIEAQRRCEIRANMDEWFITSSPFNLEKEIPDVVECDFLKVLSG